MQIKRAAIYTRVSTTDQHPEMQEQELVEYVKRRGWSLYKVSHVHPRPHSRYEYMRDRFREKAADVQARKHEIEKSEETLTDGRTITSYSMPAFELSQEASWLGIAAIPLPSRGVYGRSYFQIADARPSLLIHTSAR